MPVCQGSDTTWRHSRGNFDIGASQEESQLKPGDSHLVFGSVFCLGRPPGSGRRRLPTAVSSSLTNLSLPRGRPRRQRVRKSLWAFSASFSCKTAFQSKPADSRFQNAALINPVLSQPSQPSLKGRRLNGGVWGRAPSSIHPQILSKTLSGTDKLVCPCLRPACSVLCRVTSPQYSPDAS